MADKILSANKKTCFIPAFDGPILFVLHIFMTFSFAQNDAAVLYFQQHHSEHDLLPHIAYAKNKINQHHYNQHHYTRNIIATVAKNNKLSEIVLVSFLFWLIY